MRILISKPKENPVSVALLSFLQTCARLSRILAKYIITSDGLSPRKIAILLRTVKNDLGLKAPSVCSISCECGKVYIAQTDSSVETTLKENH